MVRFWALFFKKKFYENKYKSNQWNFPRNIWLFWWKLHQKSNKKLLHQKQNKSPRKNYFRRIKRNIIKFFMNRKQTTNFHKLICDESFWLKYSYLTLNEYRLKRFREYRTKWVIPPRKMLERWLEEDYRLITGDERESVEIMLWLVSPVS